MGQPEDPGALGGIQLQPVGLPLPLVGLLRLRQRPQGLVPVGLQFGGHQPVLGIDPQVPTAGQLSLIPGTVDLLVTQTIRLVPAYLELLLHGQRHLQGERGDPLHQQAPHRLVERPARNALTDRLAAGDARALAHIGGPEGPVPQMVPHRHPLAADAAHHEALEQGRPFPRRRSQYERRYPNRWMAVRAPPHWASAMPSRAAAQRSSANTLRMNTSSTAAVSVASKAS